MKIEKSILIDRPVTEVWSLLADDFTGIDRWFPGVHRSYAIPEADAPEGASCGGRVCELSDKPNGLKAIEHITTYDVSRYRLGFDVEIRNAPGIFPIKENSAMIQLKGMHYGQTELKFTASPKLKPHGYLLYPLLLLGLGKSFADLNKAFKAHCESTANIATA